MAPKAEKKPAKKVAKSTSSAAAKKRKLAKAETYKIYIYKVLKQVRAACFARAWFVVSTAVPELLVLRLCIGHSVSAAVLYGKKAAPLTRRARPPGAP